MSLSYLRRNPNSEHFAIKTEREERTTTYKNTCAISFSSNGRVYEAVKDIAFPDKALVLLAGGTIGLDPDSIMCVAMESTGWIKKRTGF